MSGRCISPFQITPRINRDLLRVEAVREKMSQNPAEPLQLAFFQEASKFYSTYYSTLIEGNRLEPEQAYAILKGEEFLNGCDIGVCEIKGYFAALIYIEKLIKDKQPLTETIIQTFHSLVMGNKSGSKLSGYRKGQNLVYNGRTSSVVYVPPDAKDVPGLIKNLIAWMNDVSNIPGPIIAGIAHYQLITIHPFYDGNGRLARLMASYILRQRNYDLDGMGFLEEYYASNLNAYFEAMSISPLHNYFMGRSQGDITPWVQYFMEGLAISLEEIYKKVEKAKREGLPAERYPMPKLSAKQLQALAFFSEFTTIQANQIC